MSPNTPHHETSTEQPQWLKPTAIGIAALAGVIILAPYVMPLMGVGTVKMASDSIVAMHSSGLGTGIAGAINSVLSATPFIGESIAQGGIITALTSGAIGIGGVLLGNHMQKCENGSEKISFGKLIKTASLLTSALISLPSLLTGIGIGLVYLCAALGSNALASSTAAALYNITGTMGAANIGPSVVAGGLAALPHIVTCGAAIVPTAISFSMSTDTNPQSTYLTKATQPHTQKYSDGSIAVQVETNTPIESGKPINTKIKLIHTDTGKPITSQELAVKFTEKMHIFVIDQTLQDYHHIHPTPTNNPGEFVFNFTPNTNNSYNVWTDIKLLRDDQSHRLKSTIPSARSQNIRTHIPTNTHTISDGVTINWQSPSTLRKDTSTTVDVTLTDSMGNPITDLQPLMGAYAHLVGFSADGKSIVHTHPIGEEPATANDRGGPTMRFHITPDFTGSSQFYLQFKRGGKESYAAFGQQILPPELNTQKFTPKTAHTAHSHSSHSMG